MSSITRFDRLRAHMVVHRITWRDVANVLDISESGCRMACQRDRINKDHYKRLLEFGFPENVLPAPNIREYHKAHSSQISQMAT